MSHYEATPNFFCETLAGIRALPASPPAARYSGPPSASRSGSGGGSTSAGLAAAAIAGSPIAGQDPAGAFPGPARLPGELGPEAYATATAGRGAPLVGAENRILEPPAARSQASRRRSAPA